MKEPLLDDVLENEDVENLLAAEILTIQNLFLS